MNVTKYEKKGFTLIELLVVIAIIGLLSSIVLASLQSAREKAKGAKLVQEMNQLKNAFELYKSSKGFYPGEDEFGEQRISEDCADVSQPANLYSYLNNKLVAGGYIPRIIQSESYYSNWNCKPSILYTTDYLHGDPETENIYATCGGKIMRSYLFQVYSELKLNYPVAGIYEDGVLYETNGMYCIGE